MREVLGAGRGVQAGEVEIPAMAAEAGRETRQGAESDEESDGCDGVVCLRQGEVHMSLQSRALKAVGRGAESGEDHPLETCGLHRS
jgi:hypothetical protein